MGDVSAGVDSAARVVHAGYTGCIGFQSQAVDPCQTPPSSVMPAHTLPQ